MYFICFSSMMSVKREGATKETEETEGIEETEETEGIEETKETEGIEETEETECMEGRYSFSKRGLS